MKKLLSLLLLISSVATCQAQLFTKMISSSGPQVTTTANYPTSASANASPLAINGLVSAGGTVPVGQSYSGGCSVYTTATYQFWWTSASVAPPSTLHLHWNGTAETLANEPQPANTWGGWECGVGGGTFSLTGSDAWNDTARFGPVQTGSLVASASGSVPFSVSWALVSSPLNPVKTYESTTTVKVTSPSAALSGGLNAGCSYSGSSEFNVAIVFLAS